jgi:transketolase
MDHNRARVYCVTGDGELDEGNIWEAVMFAAAKKLSNLTVIVDRNNIQIDGPTETVMPLTTWLPNGTAFGWHVVEIDGHNFDAIISACNLAKAIVERPTVIIAHTIPAKESTSWNTTTIGTATLSKPRRTSRQRRRPRSLHELRTLGGQIRSEHE